MYEALSDQDELQSAVTPTGSLQTLNPYDTHTSRLTHLTLAVVLTEGHP